MSKVSLLDASIKDFVSKGTSVVSYRDVENFIDMLRMMDVNLKDITFRVMSTTGLYLMVTRED
jgi:hypothetical protein